MTLFKKILLEAILNEDVAINRVNDAINNTYEVEINYHSKGEDIATGKRIIQPVAYGQTKSGNPVIRAFQPYGDTTTSIPHWKMFRLDRISSWIPFPEREFSEPPGNFNAQGQFNPNGDKTMSVVYNIAKFGDENVVDYSFQDKSGPIKKNKKQPIYKTDTEQGVEKLRKQLENPKYISDVIKTNSFGSTKQADSGPVKKSTLTPEKPVEKDNIFKTDTEHDIENKRDQINNPQYVSQDVLDNWKREQERRNNTKNNK